MSRAEQLQAVATTAFFDQVLPAIRSELPEIAEEIVVLITSSVAYGVADELSDLDVFIVFRRERDYSRYATRLTRLIEEIELDERYPDVCDKGVRFELESLSRSDVRRVLSDPENGRHWMAQCDWLMHWFGSALPIYDPGRIRARFDRRCSFYPPEVASWRAAGNAFRTWRHALTATRLLSDTGISFLAVRQLWRSMTTALDLAYLRGHRFGPHPKWRAQLAPVILGAGGDLQVLRRIADTVVKGIHGADVAGALTAAAQELGSWAETIGLETTVAPPAEDGRGVPDVWRFTGASGDILVTNPVMTSRPEIREAARRGGLIYLEDELGTGGLLGRHYSYDQALRISDRARWLVRHLDSQLAVPGFKLDESPGIVVRRFCYLHFVLWRKLRVVEKAVRRDQPFNSAWYLLQVVDHFLELFARLDADFLPPEELYGEALTAPPPELPEAGYVHGLALGQERILHALRAPREFCQEAWKLFSAVQRELLASGLVSEQAVTDPLSTQFDIQYWKYENQFI